MIIQMELEIFELMGKLKNGFKLILEESIYWLLSLCHELNNIILANYSGKGEYVYLWDKGLTSKVHVKCQQEDVLA